MTYRRMLERMLKAALIGCLAGFFIVPTVRTVMQAMEKVVLSSDIDAFLSGKTDSYDGFDHAGYAR